MATLPLASAEKINEDELMDDSPGLESNDVLHPNEDNTENNNSNDAASVKQSSVETTPTTKQTMANVWANVYQHDDTSGILQSGLRVLEAVPSPIDNEGFRHPDGTDKKIVRAQEEARKREVDYFRRGNPEHASVGQSSNLLEYRAHQRVPNHSQRTHLSREKRSVSRASFRTTSRTSSRRYSPAHSAVSEVHRSRSRVRPVHQRSEDQRSGPGLGLPAPHPRQRSQSPSHPVEYAKLTPQEERLWYRMKSDRIWRQDTLDNFPEMARIWYRGLGYVATPPLPLSSMRASDEVAPGIAQLLEDRRAQRQPQQEPAARVVSPPVQAPTRNDSIYVSAPFLRNTLIHQLFQAGRLSDERPLPQSKEHRWLNHYEMYVSERTLRLAREASGLSFDSDSYQHDHGYQSTILEWYWDVHGPWESRGDYFSGVLNGVWIGPQDEAAFRCREVPESHLVQDASGDPYILQRETLIAFDASGAPTSAEIYRPLMRREVPSHYMVPVGNSRLPQPIFPGQLLRPLRPEIFDNGDNTLQLVEDINASEGYHIFKRRYISSLDNRDKGGTQPRLHRWIPHVLSDGTRREVNYACPTQDCCTHQRPGQPFNSFCISYCALCGGLHQTIICTIFDTPFKRELEALALGLCFLCGLPGHTAEDCQHHIERCKVCQGKHWAAICNSHYAWSINVKMILIRKKLAFLPTISNINILALRFRVYESAAFWNQVQVYRANNYYLPGLTGFSEHSGYVPFNVLSPLILQAVQGASERNNTTQVYYCDPVEENYRISRIVNPLRRSLDFTFQRQATIAMQYRQPWSYHDRPSTQAIIQMQRQTSEMAHAVQMMTRSGRIKVLFERHVKTTLPDDIVNEAHQQAEQRPLSHLLDNVAL